MVRICERCQQRYSVASMNTDFVHQCSSGDTTLDNEDVVVIGAWEDYTGSASPSSHSLMIGTSVNLLKGTDAGVRGADFESVTDRGNRAITHRQRQRHTYKDLRK